MTYFMAPSAPTWMDDALCAQIDHDIFFPGKGETTTPAHATCQACPVTAKCLGWAMAIESEDGEMPGIYGGLTTRQRLTLRRDAA